MQEQSKKLRYVHRFYHSRARHWQFALVCMALICLVAFPLYAASFDCGKAATEMEKTICSDPKLSVLDEDLAKIYGEIKNQLKGDAQALDQLTKSQREWLAGLTQKKDGNIACAASKECLTISYQKRIKELQDKLSLALKKAPIESGEEKKYPPYPDVWGYQLSVHRAARSLGRVAKMSNGDYFISYVREFIEGKEKVNDIFTQSWLLFFAGTKKDYAKDEYGKIWKTFNDENRVIKRIPKIVFSDGSSMEHGGHSTGNCGDPYDAFLEKKDNSGKVIAKKLLLYLYNKPIKTDINNKCERNWDDNKSYFFQNVENMDFYLLPLEDNTFLIVSNNPESMIALRFDKDFKTKSDLLGKNVFLIDFDAFIDLRNKLKDSSDASVDAALATYLLTLRK